MITQIEDCMKVNRTVSGAYLQQLSWADGQWDQGLLDAIDGLVPAEVEDMFIHVYHQPGPVFGFQLVCMKDIVPNVSMKIKRHHCCVIHGTDDVDWVDVDLTLGD